MISFASDYIEGAHEAILQRFHETNLVPQTGYGEDEYCRSAKEKIRRACDAENADVFFLVGGTQTNQVVISTLLRPIEGAVCVQTGHIAVHEAGAIESTGHKVLPLPAHDGKMQAEDLRSYLTDFFANPTCDHMVFPGMVYISHPTEYGTLYTRSELAELHQVCLTWHLPLYIDGARLGYALTSPASDLPLPELARLCDVFYIGGTKVGALCGEAVVFPRGNAPEHFMTYVKQRGAMLAKGRLLGIQFDTLFTDHLYEKLGAHANRMAEKMVALFVRHGFAMACASPTNQQFVIMSHSQIEALSQDVIFEFWEKKDETHDVVRFVTSWATSEDQLRALDACLARIAEL